MWSISGKERKGARGENHLSDASLIRRVITENERQEGEHANSEQVR